MSCGRIAAQRAGLKIDKYYASEIDQPAICVTMDNYPDTIQLGDVTTWRSWDIDWSSIELLIGGSPCQGFSSAGRDRLAFEDPRSVLFFQYVDILNHIRKHNPKVKFLLENVKMKQEWADKISQILGASPVFINSSLVSAQSRQRFYWASWEFSPPQDQNIKMSDILEPGYYSTRDKSYCLDANYGKGTNFRRFFFKASRPIVLENGYVPAITTEETANDVMHADGNRWRLLLPVECERLQTVPEGYTQAAKRFERYKMLGNGWTVDVVAHIFSHLSEGTE